MPGHRWSALAVLTLGRTAMGFQFQSVGALSPLLMERLGIGHAEIGMLVGVFSLPGVVLALPGGLLGQRLGDRRLVFAALLSMMAGSARSSGRRPRSPWQWRDGCSRRSGRCC